MIVIDQDPHSKKVVRYRVYYKDEGGIESYVHYRHSFEDAKELAKLWRAEDVDSGLNTPRIRFELGV